MCWCVCQTKGQTGTQDWQKIQATELFLQVRNSFLLFPCRLLELQGQIFSGNLNGNGTFRPDFLRRKFSLFPEFNPAVRENFLSDNKEKSEICSRRMGTWFLHGQNSKEEGTETKRQERVQALASHRGSRILTYLNASGWGSWNSGIWSRDSYIFLSPGQIQIEQVLFLHCIFTGGEVSAATSKAALSWNTWCSLELIPSSFEPVHFTPSIHHG